MDYDDSHVTLVVDPDFGARAIAMSDLGPLWVIQSPKNTPVVKELWMKGNFRFADSLTSFDAVPGRTPEDSAAEFIGTALQHYPAWSVLEVIGTRLSPKLLDVMRECAAGTAKETAEGFTYSRN